MRFVLLLLLASFVPRVASSSEGSPPGLQSDPALSLASGKLLALWTDSGSGAASRLYWTRLESLAPDTVASPVNPGGAAEVGAAVASAAGWALAVWESGMPDGSVVVRAAEVSVDGPPGAVPVTDVTNGEGAIHRPAVAAGESLAVLVWEDERSAPGDVYLARWRRGTGLLDPGGVPFAAGAQDQRWPRVARGDAGFLVVWSEASGGAYRVMARRLDAEGIAQGPATAVSSPGASATWPDVAHSGVFLAVWSEQGDGGASLGGALLDDGGAPFVGWPRIVLDGPGLETAARACGADPGFALVWIDHSPLGRSLERAWIDPAGGVHPSAGIPLAPKEDYASDAALAAGGGTAWAAWRVPLAEDEDDLYVTSYAVADTASSPEAVLLTRVGATGLGVPRAERPSRLLVEPNPFRGTVRLATEALRSGRIRILDALGRLVVEVPPEGRGRWVWNGNGAGGRPVPPGVYFAFEAETGASARLVRVP